MVLAPSTFPKGGEGSTLHRCASFIHMTSVLGLIIISYILWTIKCSMTFSLDCESGFYIYIYIYEGPFISRVLFCV